MIEEEMKHETCRFNYISSFGPGTSSSFYAVGEPGFKPISGPLFCPGGGSFRVKSQGSGDSFDQDDYEIINSQCRVNGGAYHGRCKSPSKGAKI